MYPTFECHCQPEYGECTSEQCTCACHFVPSAKPGDILEDADGHRILIRHHMEQSATHYENCSCCSRNYTQHFILTDGEPLAHHDGVGTTFRPTLESFWEWPPTEHKVIRDGIIIFNCEKIELTPLEHTPQG